MLISYSIKERRRVSFVEAKRTITRKWQLSDISYLDWNNQYITLKSQTVGIASVAYAVQATRLRLKHFLKEVMTMGSSTLLVVVSKHLHEVSDK